MTAMKKRLKARKACAGSGSGGSHCSASFLLEVITELDHSPWCAHWSNERCTCRWGKKIKDAKKWLKSHLPNGKAHHVVGEVGFGPTFGAEADFYRSQAGQLGLRIADLEVEAAKLIKDRNVLRRALERCAALSEDVSNAKHEALLATAP